MSQTSAVTAGFRLRIQGPQPASAISLLVGRSLIGRNPDNPVVLDNEHVSGRHAQIDCTLTTCQIQDLKSSNGTTVNGRPCRAYETIFLSPGDVIGIALDEKSGRPLFELTLEQLAVTLPTTASATVSAGPGQAPPAARALVQPPAWAVLPPGLMRHSYRLLDYLPEIYQGDADEQAEDSGENFTARFLALFESVLLPVEWTVDNFDLWLDPATAAADFLPWLANWFAFTFDTSWSVEQQRAFLSVAHKIYQQRGTAAALMQLLTIYTSYTGVAPVIDDGAQLPAGVFTVTLPPACETQRQQIEALINRHKPAHAVYSLIFQASA